MAGNIGMQDQEMKAEDQIDWHDFVVVEKIDLYDDEEMRAIEEQEQQEAESLLNATKQQQLIMRQIQENEDFLNMPNLPEAAQVEEPNEIVISTALDPNMKIVKNYQKTNEDEAAKKTTTSAGTQKCPKCHQEIPITEWREHMKLEMMNPKWLEEKKMREQRAQLNSLAAGDEIVKNLQNFKSQRQDLFSAQPQTAGPQSQQESQQPIIWDGQAQSINRTTANIAMLQNQTQRNLQEQLQVRGTLDAKSLQKLTQPSTPMPIKQAQSAVMQQQANTTQPAKPQQQPTPAPAQTQAKPQGAAVSTEDDEDASLAALQESGQLRAESDWIRLFPGKINITINKASDPQWNSSQPQKLTLQADSRMTVQALKETIAKALGIQGVSGSKLRLRTGAQFTFAMKDTCNLAFYNIPDSGSLQVALKK